ncbi:lipid II:glycine glycyltransferase FemX [Planctomycetota bacterium]
MKISESENINFQPLDPTNYSDWDDLLEANPDASIFHSSHWSKVLADTYKYQPLFFSSIVNGQFRSLVPVMEINSILTGNRGVSLPFSDYCEPIITEQLCLEEVIESMINYGRKAGWKYLELRSADGLSEDWPCFGSYYGHTLNLSDDTEKVFSCFRSSVKRNIRKALKEGVEVRLDHSEASIKKYYHLHCLTRKRQGIPPQPYSFFNNIYNHVISRNLGFILLADYKQKNIAGGVYFSFGKKTLFKFGASDQDYQYLRANDLIMWKAIEWYCKNGYEKFCFGRTDFDNEGLKRFKSGWGIEENIIRYYRYCFSQNKFIKEEGKQKKSFTVFKKMPIPLLKFAGQVLYKHMG